MTTRVGAPSARGVTLALIAATLLPLAGVLGLLEPTETRYAEIAREMRASGDWLVPRLDGIPHFHKPPLPYWITVAGYGAFGVNEWGARIPVVVTALLTLWLVARLPARRFVGLLGDSGTGLDQPALRPVWMLASSLLFLGPGRVVSCDPYLATSVAAFWVLAPSIGAHVALGLGFMIKGPVVLIPTVLPVLVVAAIDRVRGGSRSTADAASAPRARGALALLGPGRGWLVAAAIGVPWYLAVVARERGLIDYLLGNQLVQRYASGVHHREGQPWYFLAVLAGGLVPWTPAFVAGLGAAWRARDRLAVRLLLAWLFVPLVFFSFSGSKLPAYLLPCFPAAALIAAMGWRGRVVHVATAALLAALALAGWIAGPAVWTRLVGAASAAHLALPLGVHLALAALAYGAFAAARGRASTAALATLVGLAAALIALAPHERHFGVPRPVARALREHRVPGEPVIEYRRFNAGIPFYLGEIVPLLEVPRELLFEHAGPSPVIVESDVTRLARRGRVWVLGPEAPTRELAARLGLDYTRLGTWSRSSLGYLSVP